VLSQLADDFGFLLGIITAHPRQQSSGSDIGRPGSTKRLSSVKQFETQFA
jgi:hypothetical protein